MTNKELLEWVKKWKKGAMDCSMEANLAFYSLSSLLSEPTDEERKRRLEYFDCAWSGNNYKPPCDNKDCSEYRNGKCLQTREKIRSLILDKKPKISREFLEKWAHWPIFPRLILGKSKK